MIRKCFFDYIIAVLYKVMFTTVMKVAELDLTNAKCLCLAPHADDESIGLGGTLAKFARNFDVICVTDGHKGVSGDLSREEKAEIRKRELFEAMAKINVNSTNFLDEIPDKNLILSNPNFRKIDISDYDYIFIPNILDAHRDHKALAILLLELLRTKPHKKDVKIVFYEVWSTLACVNAFVDISDFINTKKDLISTYHSQLKEYDYVNKSINLNSYRGLPYKKDYVEAFYVLDKKLLKQLSKIYIL